MRTGPSQRRAREHEKVSEKRRAETYQGVARIRLDNLAFPKHPPVPEEPTPKVIALLANFERQGCLPLDPHNHIPAEISSDQLERALEASHKNAEDLRNPPGGEIIELVFPLTESVSCLKGQSRVEAAKALLFGPNDPPGSLSPLDKDLGERYRNAARPPDGEVYYMIEHYISQRESFYADSWWVCLKPSKQKYLRQFHQHRTLYDSLNRFGPFHGLWPGMRIGMLHKVMALRCDELILAYWDAIYGFWKDLAGSQPKAIDITSVRLLESRCPLFSASDRKFLEGRLDSHELFAHASEPDRRRMWERVCAEECLIPTLHTFFEDFKYIKNCGDVLWFLVPKSPAKQDPAKQYLRQAFKDMFASSQDSIACIQRDEDDFRTAHVRAAFSIAYQQLWLCAMRHWPGVLEERPQKDFKGQTLALVSQDVARHRLAKTASKLGFSSPVILETQRATRGVGSDALSHPLQPIERRMTSGDTKHRLDLRQRRGVPFYSSWSIDRRALFIERLLARPLPEAEFTSLFVCRSLFFTLFRKEIFPVGSDTPLPGTGFTGLDHHETVVPMEVASEQGALQENMATSGHEALRQEAPEPARPAIFRFGSRGIPARKGNQSRRRRFVFHFPSQDSESFMTRSEVNAEKKATQLQAKALVLFDCNAQRMQPSDCVLVQPEGDQVDIYATRDDPEAINSLQSALAVDATTLSTENPALGSKRPLGDAYNGKNEARRRFKAFTPSRNPGGDGSSDSEL